MQANLFYVEQALKNHRKFFKYLALFAFVVIGYFTVYRAAWSPTERTDYTVYLAAGQAVLDGVNIYEVQSARGWNYVYPPPFALLLPIFALMPKILGAIIWYLLSVFSILAGIEMSVRMLEMATNRSYDRHVLYAWVLILLAVVLVGGTMRCQASEFMIALIIGAFYFYFKKNLPLSALCLSAAILLKVFPITLLAYFFIRKQWKLMVYVFAGLFFLGWVIPSIFWGVDQNIAYIHDWFKIVAGPVLQSRNGRTDSVLFTQLLDTAKPRNQSLEALLLTLGVYAEYTKYYVVVIALSMLGVLLLLSRKTLSAAQELLLCSGFIIWHLIIPPISEGHYFGVLIMPLTILLGLLMYFRDVQLQNFLQYKNHTNIITLVVLMAMILMNFNSTELMRPLCIASLLLYFFSTYYIKHSQKFKRV